MLTAANVFVSLDTAMRGSQDGFQSVQVPALVEHDQESDPTIGQVG
jgi:hypothetical protein